MAKKKPANSEQHLDEVLPAVPSPAEDFDESDDTQDYINDSVKNDAPLGYIKPDDLKDKSLDSLPVYRRDNDALLGYVSRDGLAEEAAHAEIARLKAELAASKPIENASGESAWYFDASQNPTPLAVPVGVAYGKTQAEALSRFLARSGVGTLAKSPVCEIATAEQIKQYGAK